MPELKEEELAAELESDPVWYASRLDRNARICLSGRSDNLRRRLIAASFLYISSLAEEWYKAITASDRKASAMWGQFATRTHKLRMKLLRKYCPKNKTKNDILDRLSGELSFLEQVNAGDVLAEVKWECPRPYIVTEAILEGLDTAFLDRIIESPLHENLIYGRELEILFLQGIRNRYTDLVKYAVGRGAVIDRLYGIGYGEEFTPIMLTRGYARIIDGRPVWIPGDPETAEYLVSIGANVLQENTNGHNFLDLLFFSDNDCGDGDSIPSGTLCRISARKFNRTCSLIELCLERGAKIRKSPKYGLYPYAVCISSVYEKMPEYLDTLLRVRPECFEDYTGARLERDEVNRAISEGIAVNDDDDGTFRIGAGREEFNTAAGQRIRTELRCRIRAVLTGERNESGRYGEYLLSYIRLAGAEEAFFKKIRRYENPLVKMLMNCRPKNVVSYAALDIAAKILKL